MFISGLVTGVRMSLGWVYMMEFVSNNHQTVLGSVHLMVENIIIIIAALYFDVISKNWLWLALAGLVGEFAGLIMNALFIPESPKFLIM
jgi:hypothetical protein